MNRPILLDPGDGSTYPVQDVIIRQNATVDLRGLQHWRICRMHAVIYALHVSALARCNARLQIDDTKVWFELPPLSLYH